MIKNVPTVVNPIVLTTGVVLFDRHYCLKSVHHPCNNMAIISTNIRGVIGKFDETSDFLTSNSYVDILCLCETLLTDNIPDSALSIPGFNFFRKDRPGGWGGILVYYKEQLSTSRLFALESDEFESIWFLLKSGNINYLISNVYWPPNSTVDLTHHLSSCLGTYNFDYNTIPIIFGDFNAHNVAWKHCTRTNSAGRLLEDFLNSNDYEQLVDSPTRITTATQSCLDFILTNNPNIIDINGILPPLGTSDHCMVSASLKHSMTTTSQPIYHSKLKLNIKNWQGLNDHLLNIDWHTVLDSNNIETNWNTFLQNIYGAINAFGQYYKTKQKYQSTNIFLKDETYLRLKSLKLLHWQNYMKTQDQYHYNCFSSVRKKLRKHLRQLKKLYFKNKVSSILTSNYNSKKWHQLAKDLYISSAVSSVVPKLIYNTETYDTDEGKAAILNECFTNRANKPMCFFPSIPPRTEKVISDVHIDISSISATLASLDTSKATGPDEISNLLLRNCHEALATPLWLLFRQALEIGTLPSDWKYAYVSPIFKHKGSKSDPHNY